MYYNTQLYQSCYDLKVLPKIDKNENNSENFFDLKYRL